MLDRDHLISIATLTDYHLQDFIRCPYQFYFRHIERKATAKLVWRQVVQSAVNQIINQYYKLPPTSQTSTKILEFIHHHWRTVDVHLFESKAHYYMVLAQITDHLLQFLTPTTHKYPPVFLYEKLNIHIEELGINLALTFEVVEWSNDSFIVKKYLVDSNDEMNHLLKNLILIFCQKAFGQLPEEIQLISLMEGKMDSYGSTRDGVSDGLDYLNVIQHLIQDPKKYLKTNSLTDCQSCPYYKRCKIT